MEDFSCCHWWTQPDGCAVTGHCMQEDSGVPGVPTPGEFYAACAVAKRCGYGPPREVEPQAGLDRPTPVRKPTGFVQIGLWGGGNVMTGSTHFAAGAALGALAGALAGQPLAGAAVGGLAGLLADIDHPGSKLGQKARPLAILLEEKWGHRESPAHTLVFLVPAGVVLGLLAGIVVGHAVILALAGTLGAASHLALDGVTRSGVAPFRSLPFVKREVRERRFRGPVRTGQDWREHAVAALSWLAVAALIALR